ncbi:MAG: serine hydrolase [Flavobacteriales bacterium]
MRTIVLALLLTATAAQAQQTYFPPIVGNTWETVDPAALGWCTDQLPALNSFLQQNNTKAFIVLKDGRIAIEQYFGTFTQDSLWYWASAGKSLTAFLVGKAQEEGFLDINAPSSTYLGTGWTSCTPAQEAAITVRNQLTMTSGLDDTGDLDCTAPSCLTYLAEPGNRWSYHNAPYTLLDGVITGATGQTLNSYLFNKLTLTTGLQGAFVQVGSNNVFFSKARALARFGLLALAQGQWNGNPVMRDAAYFEAMVTPSQTLNPAYGYLWWLNGQQSYLLPGIQLQLPGPLMPDAPLDTYSAMGKNGQLCNVSPATGLVVVRMGDLPGGIFVPNVFNNEIWQYLNAVICLPTAVDAPHRTNGLAIYPNPASDQITVSMAGAIPQRIKVRGADGRECLSVQQLGKVDTSLLPPGTYLVEATGADGAVVRNKLISAR